MSDKEPHKVHEEEKKRRGEINEGGNGRKSRVRGNKHLKILNWTKNG